MKIFRLICTVASCLLFLLGLAILALAAYVASLGCGGEALADLIGVFFVWFLAAAISEALDSGQTEGACQKKTSKKPPVYEVFLRASRLRANAELCSSSEKERILLIVEEALALIGDATDSDKKRRKSMRASNRRLDEAEALL